MSFTVATYNALPQRTSSRSGIPGVAGDTALPSPDQPSDHLALVAAFDWEG